MASINYLMIQSWWEINPQREAMLRTPSKSFISKRIKIPTITTKTPQLPIPKIPIRACIVKDLLEIGSFLFMQMKKLNSIVKTEQRHWGGGVTVKPANEGFAIFAWCVIIVDLLTSTILLHFYCCFFFPQRNGRPQNCKWDCNICNRSRCSLSIPWSGLPLFLIIGLFAKGSAR